MLGFRLCFCLDLLNNQEIWLLHKQGAFFDIDFVFYEEPLMLPIIKFGLYVRTCTIFLTLCQIFCGIAYYH